MAEYVRVDKEPSKLQENECVIHKPDFSEELEKTKRRRGVSGLTTVANLRAIFMEITNNYDHSINPYHMKLTKYEGRKFDNDEELKQIIFKIIEDLDLPLIDKAVDHSIKSRPSHTDTIYYVSPDLEGSSAFVRNGINMKEQKSDKKTKVNG